MKKFIAILLSVLCIGTCFGFGASAEENLTGNLTGDLTTIFENILDVELPEDEPLAYGVIYNVQEFDFVSVMYKPSPSISFSNPGTYTITSDTPLSVDYEFVCWRHAETGKHYYAGDKLYVDGQEILYAEWTEKTDDDIRITRVIKTALETLKRTIGAFLGIINNVVEFDEDYKNPPEIEQPTGVIELNSTKIGVLYDYEKDPRSFRIYILTDEFDTAALANSSTARVFFGDKEYSAIYDITDETGKVNGVDYQFIKARLVDGVPTPERGLRFTFEIPEGYLKTADGKINGAYAGSFLTTDYV